MKVATTAPQALQILWKDRVFLSPKTFQDLKNALAKQGYNFTDPNRANALARAKFLTKRGDPGNFTFVQKHPYVEEVKNAKPRQKRKAIGQSRKTHQAP